MHPDIRVRRIYDDLKRHDLSRAPEYWGPETVDHFLPVGVFQGTEAIRRYFEEMFAAVPDFDSDFAQAHATDDRDLASYCCDECVHADSLYE